jgi:N-methylhydantoinase B
MTMPRTKTAPGKAAAAPSPIMQEVVNAALRYVIREMRTTLIRSSYSPVLYETHDLSCSLSDRDGQVVAMYVDVPLHIFPTVFSAAHLWERFGDDIEPGDLFVTNDPWTAGSHMNDIQVQIPIFVDGEIELVGTVRAHHGDVGGMTPGSLSGAATSIHQEGLRLPLLRLARGGEVDRGVRDILLANVRQPFETEGVLAGQMAVCELASRRVNEIFHRYGRDVAVACIEANLEASRQRLARRIGALDDGEYVAEDYLENSGTGGENRKPIYIRSKMTIEGERIVFDFTDSSPQRAGAGNATLPDTWCGAFTAVQTMLDSAAVSTTNGMKQIEVRTTPGTVVDALYPSPVTGFSDLMFGPVSGSCVSLLAQAIPDEVSAPVGSGSNQLILSGPEDPSGKPWFIFEFAFSGWPAVKDHDGNITCFHWTNGDLAEFWPAERIDFATPLRILSNDLYADSGGPGLRRGGLGVKRAWQVLGPTEMSFLGSDGLLTRPGMAGGYGGALNKLCLFRDGKEVPLGEVPQKVSAFPLEVGDVLVLMLAGGSAYGDPLQRPVEDVLEDVLAGYVTEAGAREDYGVAISGDQLDIPATTALREQRGAARTLLEISLAGEDEFDEDGRRVARLHPATARSLDVGHGDLVEIARPDRTSLRAWVLIDPEAAAGTLAIGPRGADAAGVSAGERVWVRSPWCYASRQPLEERVAEILALSRAIPAGSGAGS